MVFGKLFKKRESLIGLDLGTGTIKLVELDVSAEKPALANVGVAATPADAIQGNAVVNSESLADAIVGLLEESGVADKRVAVALPGPSVFTKRVKMARMGLADLADNVQLEAANFIPHNVNAVKLDFHILGEAGKNQIEILVVAVKEEIADSFLEVISMAGLEVAVADVDYFALQNTFELAHPELVEKTVALINIGSRYSSINICRGGGSLFTGDVSLGGRLFTDALMEQLGVSLDEAEQLKRGNSSGSSKVEDAKEIMEKNIEYAASEFNRQLSFFWGASGSDDGIDRILVTGGGARVAGLLEEISEKTGIVCQPLDPMKGIEVPSGFDKAYIKDLGPSLAVAVGLGLREPGDKIIPDFME